MPFFRLPYEIDKVFYDEDFDTCTRMLLDVWLESFTKYNVATDRWTHARMQFSCPSAGNSPYIENWKLLQFSDDHTQLDEATLRDRWLYSSEMREYCEKFLRLYGVGSGASNAQLTVWFDPARLSVDVFDGRANTLFAEFLVDVPREQVLQQQLSIVLNRGGYSICSG